jgi:formylglycine-generating enzyme required for sulfatase activity
MDMVGNVWEWTGSLYRPYPYDAGDGREDMQAEGERVARGGSWVNILSSVNVVRRAWGGDPVYTGYYLGFRCARSVFGE